VVNLDVRSLDREGGTVSSRYAWSVDGVLQADLTGDRVPASRTTKGQSWKVVVTGTVCPDGTTCQAALGYHFCVE
jgi:hypothetical protein